MAGQPQGGGGPRVLPQPQEGARLCRRALSASAPQRRENTFVLFKLPVCGAQWGGEVYTRWILSVQVRPPEPPWQIPVPPVTFSGTPPGCSRPLATCAHPTPCTHAAQMPRFTDKPAGSPDTEQRRHLDSSCPGALIGGPLEGEADSGTDN